MEDFRVDVVVGKGPGAAAPLSGHTLLIDATAHGRRTSRFAG
jgi:hypothetical protein